MGGLETLPTLKYVHVFDDNVFDLRVVSVRRSPYCVALSLPVHRLSKSILLKNSQEAPQETRSSTFQALTFVSLLNECATLSFGGIQRFLGLFCMNP